WCSPRNIRAASLSRPPLSSTWVLWCAPSNPHAPLRATIRPPPPPRQSTGSTSLQGRQSPSMGRVVGLFVGTMPGDPMTSVAEVTAVAGKGLDGDRYAEGRGTFSSTPGTGRQVTLIESEAVAAAGREYGVAVDPSQTRRNVVTADVPLNHLVGREFTVGDVRLRGVR